MRLTNGTRDLIVANVLTKTFEKRLKANKEIENTLALAVRNSALGKHKAAFDALPAEFVSASSAIRANVGGLKLWLHYAKDTRSANETISVSGPLRDKCEALMREQEKLDKDRVALRSQVKALVYSVSTADRLREVWPEGKEYYEPYLESRALVSTTEINQRIKKAREST